MSTKTTLGFFLVPILLLLCTLTFINFPYGKADEGPFGYIMEIPNEVS